MGALIRYIKSFNVVDNSAGFLYHATWSINEAIIKTIRVITVSTDWDFTIYCNDDQVSGMFSSLKIASNLSGTQTIFLDISYINDKDGSSIYYLYVDNAGSDNAAVDVWGEKARVT